MDDNSRKCSSSAEDSAQLHLQPATYISGWNITQIKLVPSTVEITVRLRFGVLNLFRPFTVEGVLSLLYCSQFGLQRRLEQSRFALFVRFHGYVYQLYHSVVSLKYRLEAKELLAVT